MFCELLWVCPKEFVFTVMFCGWVRRSMCVISDFVGGSEGVCVYCEFLWMGPKECVCTIRFCGCVRKSVCVL